MTASGSRRCPGIPMDLSMLREDERIVKSSRPRRSHVAERDVAVAARVPAGEELADGQVDLGPVQHPVASLGQPPAAPFGLTGPAPLAPAPPGVSPAPP